MSLADPLVQFAASLAAIGVLVAACRLLGFANVPKLADAAEAARIADEALTGFRATEVALASGGDGALLQGADGRIALVRAAGDRWVVRIAAAGARLDGDALMVQEAGGGRARLALPDPSRWAARLA